MDEHLRTLEKLAQNDPEAARKLERWHERISQKPLTAEDYLSKPGTPMKKLDGLNFYVFLYALDAPRRYEGLPHPNTIGFGYHGKNEHLVEGLQRVATQVSWLRTNMQQLRAKHGNQFPDCVQYEVYARFEGEERMIGNRLMSEDECYAKARELMEGRHG